MADQIGGLATVILETDDLPRVPFPCEEWPKANGKIFVRGLTGAERLEWEQCFADPLKRTVVLVCDDPRAVVAGRAIVCEFGGRVFTDEQIQALSGKNGAVLDRAYDAILRLSGIRATAKEIEAERKNSKETTGDGSS